MLLSFTTKQQINTNGEPFSLSPVRSVIMETADPRFFVIIILDRYYTVVDGKWYYRLYNVPIARGRVVSQLLHRIMFYFNPKGC